MCLCNCAGLSRLKTRLCTPEGIEDHPHDLIRGQSQRQDRLCAMMDQHLSRQNYVYGLSLNILVSVLPVSILSMYLIFSILPIYLMSRKHHSCVSPSSLSAVDFATIRMLLSKLIVKVFLGSASFTSRTDLTVMWFLCSIQIRSYEVFKLYSICRVGRYGYQQTCYS